MNHLAFLDEILLDALAFCDKEESYDYIGTQRYNIELDSDLTDEERRDAFLVLRAAQVIDLNKRDEVEEIRKDIFRILYPGCFYGQTAIIDHDKLGPAIWEAMEIRDDVGELCWIHYNATSGGEPFVHFGGYMKAEEQDTANFLLDARVEAFLNRLHVEEVAA